VEGVEVEVGVVVGVVVGVRVYPVCGRLQKRDQRTGRTGGGRPAVRGRKMAAAEERVQVDPCVDLRAPIMKEIFRQRNDEQHTKRNSKARFGTKDFAACSLLMRVCDRRYRHG
jgi:hypothetical protein